MAKKIDLTTKTAEFREALEQFLVRIREDRYILAAVLVGSLTEETIWWKDSSV